MSDGELRASRALADHRAKVGEELRRQAEAPPISCDLCGKPIEPGPELRQAWVQVVGYAPPRGAVGGTNTLAMKEPTGRAVHDFCGKLARHGLTQQKTMF